MRACKHESTRTVWTGDGQPTRVRQSRRRREEWRQWYAAYLQTDAKGTRRHLPRMPRAISRRCPMTDNVTARRVPLRKAGFHPLPLEGKAPRMPGWQQKFDTTKDEIRLWPKTWHLARNTGVLAKFTPAIDIDITIEEAAEAVGALARERLEEHGDIHVRCGKPPKRLIPLRTDEPFAKLSRVFIAPNGTEQKIEILGNGQQYVVDGIHPETRQPYRWHGGDLHTIKREDLPYVRREDMEKFLDAAARLLVEEFDFRAVQGGNS